MTERQGPRAWLGDVLSRPVVAAAVLLGLYVLLSFAMSTGGYLGTDTGAKVATLDVMAERGTWSPGLGYWAEDLDPDGSLHPVLDAQLVDGDWVHVTTLPMLLAGRPLYELGGYRLALLLPMAGAVGAAFACRALARRASSQGDAGLADRAGWLAFWVVGLASPVAVYALDFWEHAPGVALLLGAIAAYAAIVDGDRSVWWGVAAGAALGSAATMRTESFVYGLVVVAVAGGTLLVRTRRPWVPLQLGVLSVAGFAVPWLANRVVEGLVGGNSRSARVSGAASRSFIDELPERGREIVITLFNARTADGTEAVGLLFVGLVAAALVLQRPQQERTQRLVLVAAAAVQVVLVLSGLDFVPGMLVAAPLAIAGLLDWPPAPQRGARAVLAAAVVALPLVWAYQYLGGARPQWAGRYALTSCLVLVSLGVAALARRGNRSLTVGLVGLSVVVTASGVAWLSQRSHAVDAYFEQLVGRPEDVIVVRNGFLVREGGATYSDRRWLTAVSEDDLLEAVEVVERAGATSFAVVDGDADGSARLGDAVLRSTSHDKVIGTDFYLHSYVLDAE